MSIVKILILIYFVAFSFTKAYGTEKADSLYKVLKIKETRDYYVINLRRNDSLFKVISKKVSLDKKPNLELLRKEKYYYFDFGKKDNDTTKVKTEPLVGIINNLDVKNKHVFIDGDTRIKFTKRFHYHLYTTKNLNGLYYCPSHL